MEVNSRGIKKKGPKGSPVVQYDMEGNLIAEFKSIQEASKITGINAASISGCANFTKRQAGGFKFKFKGF